MLTEFGMQLRSIRLAYGDHILNMAEKLGVSTAYISRLDRGTTPLPDAAWKDWDRRNEDALVIDNTDEDDE